MQAVRSSQRQYGKTLVFPLVSGQMGFRCTSQAPEGISGTPCNDLLSKRLVPRRQIKCGEFWDVLCVDWGFGS